MAVENGDFDVEIDDAAFEIENEGWEETPIRVCLSTAQDDDTTENCVSTGISNNGLNFKKVDLGDELVGSFGSATSVECQSNHSLDNVNSDPQMDDEFDALLSQIDETEMKKVATPKKLPKSTNGFSSPGDEASFFSSQDDTNPHPPMKRRFPGPAGLLPHLRKGELKFINMTPHPLYQKVSKLVSETSENNSNTHSTNVRFSSTPIRNNKVRGGSEILLSKAPWKKMVNSLNLNMKDENGLLNILNIKWLQAKAKKFPEEMKIPFLAVIVQGTLEVNSSKKKLRYKNPSVKLMDPTGTIVAAFNPNFVDAYGSKIVPGTALALRNCRVITLKKHLILAIAKKNLLYLATTRSEDPEEEHQTETRNSETEPGFKTEKDVSEIKNGPLLLEKILEEYNEISMKLNAQNKADFQDQSEIETSHRPSLFSTVSSASNQIRSSESLFHIPQLVPERSSIKTAATALNQFQQNQEFDTAIFSADASSGFDDDDDDELLQALDCIDFVIDEDSM